MTTRVYLYQGNRDNSSQLSEFIRAKMRLTRLYGAYRIRSGLDDMLFQVWIEFDTEEEACMFKLSEL